MPENTFLFGLIIGISAAIVPGPVIIMIITQTLKRGFVAGILVALGPFTVDALVMIPASFTLQSFLAAREAQAIIAILGFIFLSYLGINTILSTPKEALQVDISQINALLPKTFFSCYRDGIITQLLSPYA